MNNSMELSLELNFHANWHIPVLFTIIFVSMYLWTFMSAFWISSGILHISTHCNLMFSDEDPFPEHGGTCRVVKLFGVGEGLGWRWTVLEAEIETKIPMIRSAFTSSSAKHVLTFLQLKSEVGSVIEPIICRSQQGFHYKRLVLELLLILIAHDMIHPFHNLQLNWASVYHFTMPVFNCVTFTFLNVTFATLGHETSSFQEERGPWKRDWLTGCSVREEPVFVSI